MNADDWSLICISPASGETIPPESSVDSRECGANKVTLIFGALCSFGETTCEVIILHFACETTRGSAGARAREALKINVFSEAGSRTPVSTVRA